MTMLSHFAASGGAIPTYIEDVFSTSLYDGNGSTQTITNGIDLAGKGGLVWLKKRIAAASNGLYDTARGAGQLLISENVNPQSAYNGVTGFGASGFTLGSGNEFNQSTQTFVGWTFRKQPKFFTIVTWTGNGTGNRTISHDLGSVPGCIIHKGLNNNANWFVYHRSVGTSQNGLLQSTDDFNSTNATNAFGGVAPTSSVFTVGPSGNNNGWTYVAYIFAHNAGGFGLTGADNVISCGSFSVNVNGDITTPVNLGFEPQWVLVKASSTTSNWLIYDNMRGLPVGDSARTLYANSSAAEVNNAGGLSLNATGFGGFSLPTSSTCIFIAIRRPMKTPTSGSQVFAPATRTGTGGAATITSAGFPPDLYLPRRRNTTSGSNYWWDRLRGASVYLASDTVGPEVFGTRLTSLDQSGVTLSTTDPNASGDSYVDWFFRRAPGFFDAVCYRGTGSARTINHNLGVTPELIIVKDRTASAGLNHNWMVYSSSQGISKIAHVNTTDPFYNPGVAVWGASDPTASVFGVGAVDDVNQSTYNYVAYLFASCPGVSKVGTYTGNGSSQTIDCGFTNGARFVLIKATSTTGGWIVFDSARGITSSSDPFLVLNSTAAESSGFNYVDASASGFTLASASLNNSGVNYIFLAIA